MNPTNTARSENVDTVPANPNPKNKSNGNFFKLDTRIIKYMALNGFNSAEITAYILIVSGTGRDHITSKWSARAMRKYAGIRRGHDKACIEKLIKTGLIKKRGTNNRPIYQVLSYRDWLFPIDKLSAAQLKLYDFIEQGDQPDEKQSPQVIKNLLKQRYIHNVEVSDSNKKRFEILEAVDEERNYLIWLPSEFIEGTSSGELPAIHRLRSLQDPLAIYLLMDAYLLTDLSAHSGIPNNIISASYEVKGYNGNDGIRLLQIENSSQIITQWADFQNNPEFTNAHLETTGHERSADKFWNRWKRLSEIGLIEVLPHLSEQKPGEDCPLNASLVHPMKFDSSNSIETQLGQLAVRVSKALLLNKQSYHMEANEVIIPVQMGCEYQIIGVFRPVYRAKTKLEKIRWSIYKQDCEEHLDYYQRLLDKFNKGSEIKPASEPDLNKPDNYADPFELLH